MKIKKREGLHVQVWKLEIFQQVLLKHSTRCDDVYEENDNVSNIFVIALLRGAVSGISGLSVGWL